MRVCKFPACKEDGEGGTRKCSTESCTLRLHHYCFTEFTNKYSIPDPEGDAAYCWCCCECSPDAQIEEAVKEESKLSKASPISSPPGPEPAPPRSPSPPSATPATLQPVLAATESDRRPTRSTSGPMRQVPGADGVTQLLYVGGDDADNPSHVIELGGRQIVEDLSKPPPLPEDLLQVTIPPPPAECDPPLPAPVAVDLDLEEGGPAHGTAGDQLAEEDKVEAMVEAEGAAGNAQQQESTAAVCMDVAVGASNTESGNKSRVEVVTEAEGAEEDSPTQCVATEYKSVSSAEVAVATFPKRDTSVSESIHQVAERQINEKTYTSRQVSCICGSQCFEDCVCGLQVPQPVPLLSMPPGALSYFLKVNEEKMEAEKAALLQLHPDSEVLKTASSTNLTLEQMSETWDWRSRLTEHSEHIKDACQNAYKSIAKPRLEKMFKEMNTTSEWSFVMRPDAKTIVGRMKYGFCSRMWQEGPLDNPLEAQLPILVICAGVQQNLLKTRGSSASKTISVQGTLTRGDFVLASDSSLYIFVAGVGIISPMLSAKDVQKESIQLDDRDWLPEKLEHLHSQVKAVLWRGGAQLYIEVCHMACRYVDCLAM